ncbi:hypothetical protein TQ39_17530 [Ruthenibacterium lactatiformans]|uniref:BppU N-terminal domain-containing protein n=1 Tax=Ruthenibacterium lactatiformans TaxID=1550024 RepID=A0A0D8IYB2_9FIRM|nr:BppU family phage baseplate upper protein [Ruthenibacterium lactatiformans]KJF38523.1 hypothetical protein TQ39_17530 [Ruthenibacterium lactatiformans]
MQVTKNITLDLIETGSPVIIKAKQNDRNTRYIAAHLYVGRLDYQVPSGTEIAFRYKKPDGTAGFYDALPDNSPAITVSGNTVTVELVEQVLTVSGCVHCEINMYNAASEKLTTFTFEISVEESVLTDAKIISSDYYNVLTAEIAKALQAVTDATEQAENAAQSAQDAADSAAMSKDWAAGQPVTYSGTPVSIAYAGAQRIASITAYGETPQGGTTEAPVLLTGISSITVNDDVTELPIPRPLRRVGDVKDKCVTRQDYESAEKLVVTYNVGFVELDGAENWIKHTTIDNAFYIDGLIGGTVIDNTQSNFALCSAAQQIRYNAVMIIANGQFAIGTTSNVLRTVFCNTACESLDDWKSYLTAQKEAGTPVQVAYQLATPETYATDPIDFDNAAGPLTVMTGGEVEVRMTELVGTRSDVSNNTVAFTETAQDADISSGEKLSVLFGKIKKRFSAMLAAIADRYTKAEAEARFMPNPNLLDNSDFVRRVNQRGVSGTITTAGYFIDRWKLVSGSVTLSADGLQLAAGTVIAQILEYAAGTDVIASLGITSGTASAAYDNATKTYTITATTACTLIWAKLEKGNIATPYVPKGYGAELAECMRYFEIAKMGFTYSQLPSNYLCTTSFKVQKRTIPTVTVVAGSIKNLYESLIDTSVTAVSTTRDSIVSVALSQTVLNNQAITLTAVLSADL